MVAKMMQKFDTIGIDLVSATANDIVVLGAKPLTLLDYIANDKLNPSIVEQIVLGMVNACKENDIALIGGETAEMPGTYLPGEHDLVGVITGVVEKEAVILGKLIEHGDIVLGLASSGLHTNGYSLARHLFFNEANYQVDSYLADLKQTVGETLLSPHLNYTKPVQQLLKTGIQIKGMAHITGGGLLENIPRILPEHCAVEIQKNSWPQLPVFEVLASLAKSSDQELYRTFNMGIGLVIIVAPSQVSALKQVLKSESAYTLHEIGVVIPGEQEVQLI
jgi:phosphoribosylformylglycinamidine cyclo-ligase